MNIETKFNIGDTVWFMWDNTVKSGVVLKIVIQIYPEPSDPKIGQIFSMGSCNITYVILFGKDRITQEVDRLYSTKKELLDSL